MQQKEITWKTNNLLFFICLCFFIFIVSCGGGKDGIPDFDPETSDTTPGSISKSLVARIYFDATLSMQGFVIPGATQYTQMCRYLESVIVSGWENATVNFFRFGEQVELIDRNTYLNLSRTGFYEDSRIFRETFIEKIIDHEAQLTQVEVEEVEEVEVEEGVTTEDSTESTTPEETDNNGKESPLVVIVTDLFQDNRDLTILVTQLKEQYIQKGYEIGLLGLRSEFDGTVYDLGEAPLPYSSTPGKPETFRPFYLLVLGKHSDIAHYFDRLIAKGFSEAQTIIFSEHLVDSFLSFENATIEKLVNLNRVSIAKEPDPQLKEYRINDKNKPSQISAELKLQFLSHVMPFDTEKFEVKIIAEYKSDARDKNEISLDAQRCLEVTSTHSKNDSNELRVGFNLDSQSLPRKRIYLYEITLSPRIDRFKEPDWCSEWDMGDERNGARTLNLVNFVRDLSQVSTRTHQPFIAKFHFYIEKR